MNFLELIREMRNAQIDYFTHRLQEGNSERMLKMKELEAKVDAQLKIQEEVIEL